MRIAVGGIEHESSNYSPLETPLSEFRQHVRSLGPDDLRKLPGDENTVMSGFVAGVRQCSADMIPLLYAHAPSGRQPTLETHHTLKGELVQLLDDAPDVDGVLLALHGAYSVQGIDDGDGDILQAVRQVVGPQCPVIAVHDPHCNIGPLMVANATALIIENTYPHIDMAERAREAAELLVRTIQGDVRPTMAWRSIPMFWAAEKMISSQEPMRSAYQRQFAIEARPNVLSASIGLGYQWADVPIAGASTIAVTESDADAAQECADELANWIWHRRTEWQRTPLSPRDALAQGDRIGQYPIILADQADNPGGGAPSDSTEILRLFLELQLEPAAVLYLRDPETVHRAMQVGVGESVDVEVGGKSHELSGKPVALRVEVAAISDGRFTYDGPMFANARGNYGDSVLLKHGELYLVVITESHQPIDLAFCRSLGLDCRKMKYLCLKSTGHFRSGFEPIAGAIFNVDASGVFTQDFSRIPFRRLGRPVFPMNPDTELALDR